MGFIRGLDLAVRDGGDVSKGWDAHRRGVIGKQRRQLTITVSQKATIGFCVLLGSQIKRKVISTFKHH